MASPQSSQEYLEDAQLVIDDLREDGHLASFGIEAPTADHLPPGPYQEIGQAHVLPIPAPTEFSSHYSDDIRRDDEFFMVTNEVDLKLCTHKDTTQQIHRVLESFAPDNITLIYYFLQVRCLA